MPILREISASQKNKIGLATLLSGLVSLSVVLTLTILLIASYQSKKQALYDTTLTLNFSNSSKMSQTLNSLFISMRSSLRYSADVISSNPAMSQEEMDEHIELIRQSSNYFNSILVVDETGLIRSASPQSLGIAGTVIVTDAAKEALASRKPYLSNPYTSVKTGRLIVFMSEPLFDKSGTYRGLIAGTLYLQENNIMNMIFGSNKVDDLGSYFYVVSSNGRLLYHPDLTRIGEDVNANTIVRKLVQNKSGQEQMVNLKGVPMLAGYSTVPETGWGVVVVTPISTLKEQLNRHIQILLLYILFPFIILLLAAIWLARRLARPFVSLANLVGKIGREQVVLPVTKPHWNREADLLTRTIMTALTDIRKRTDQLTQDAMTDPLTGLINRRTLESIMSRWISEHLPFSIIVLDIDRFKTINDSYGHQTGDEVLKHLAKIVTLCIRPGDVCCRYGGEEFVVLLAQASVEDSYLAAERIRKTLETSENPVGRTITVSLGVAHFPSHSESAEALFHLADQALYKAKDAGRNRTVVASTTD